uniref:Xylanolytic transcriptional activator regulatory domain-containing protein n=1 Tax=Bionectria ochroleuca TaxID=29856 RepID=A0A0B7KA21_BIOOC
MATSPSIPSGLVASSLPSPDPEHGGNLTSRLSSSQVDLDQSSSRDLAPHESSRQTAPGVAFGSPFPMSVEQVPPAHDTPSSLQLLQEAHRARVPPMSRLVKDTKGLYMFIGDSATLSFLQNIRRIVRRSLENCAFVSDPLRHLIVEATPCSGSGSGPDSDRGWIMSSARNPPPRPSVAEAEYLQTWYRRSANCVLLLFDDQDLDHRITEWLHNGNDAATPASSVYYLVFAIGAQTGPHDKDDLAQAFFNYGRYLTVDTLMEDPDIPTIQAFALIAMYLLGASRRNSAFMYLGMAVRAAYALGLHRKDVSALYPPDEFQRRERVWKAIRILDLFMSASLGRPPSTAETRNTSSVENYSACNDLSNIFESVLLDVYAKRVISTEVLERISKEHRRWAAQSSQGLELDGIPLGGETEISGQEPNIGLLHLKQTAYWTIILLSLPFLLKMVSSHVDSTVGDHLIPDQGKALPSNQALVFACLESAIGSIDLFQPLLVSESLPKRLPFVMNSIFVSGLVIGAAIFGDLDTNFPLKHSLRLARSALKRFGQHDAIAKRHSVILEHFQEACDEYIEMRTRRKMERHGHLVKGLFGCINTIGEDAPDSGQRSTEKQLKDNSPDDIYASFLPAFCNVGEQGINMGLMNLTGNDAQNEAARSIAQTNGTRESDSVQTEDNLATMAPSMSPNMLWFDSLGNNMSLFPVVDAHAIDKDAVDSNSFTPSFMY